MSTNVKAFVTAVNKFSEDLKHDKFVAFQKRIAFELLSRTVLKTPVDTGRARNAWQLAIGKVPQGETPSESAGQALARLKFGQTIFLANNVPYIILLEHGHSAQAPSGMLAVSIEEVRAMFP